MDAYHSFLLLQRSVSILSSDWLSFQIGRRPNTTYSIPEPKAKSIAISLDLFLVSEASEIFESSIAKAAGVVMYQGLGASSVGDQRKKKQPDSTSAKKKGGKKERRKGKKKGKPLLSRAPFKNVTEKRAPPPFHGR